MKKYIILGLSVALAAFTTTSCNQDLLNIQQKGVIAYEDFYKTDADAQSALTAVYDEFIALINAQGSNNPAWATSCTGAAARRTAVAPAARK